MIHSLFSRFVLTGLSLTVSLPLASTLHAQATDPASFQVPPGFKVELLYTVPKEQQGSWVAITVDPKGRLITSNQDGGLFRVTPQPVGSSEPAKIEAISTDLVGAHGLLYAFNSLYVMVNEGGLRGVFRMREKDGVFGKSELIRKIDHHMGEHGTHGLALSPDGKSIWFTCGNHTSLPEHLEKSHPIAYKEDHLLPRLWDANGHAKDVLAPGGYVCKMDPDGKEVELISIGFRNTYDIAFDANGELFTYDSDMEWDIGSPWYMPTRINHVVAGADYGWRSGAGRWPAYYADSLPGGLDIGPGCPTGTVFGTGAKFPAKYQQAMFACDWTYGTMYAIHLKPNGATYGGEKEEFLSGKPLPLTDVIIHPDGAMYFTIGGRKTQSALYRVSYAGTESIAPAAPAPVTADVKLRREIEQLQLSTDPAVVEKVWARLGSKDRFLRFTARVVLEHQPVAGWMEKALSETDPQTAIEALIALARMGDKSLQPRLLEALGKFDYTKLPPELRLPIIRAAELVFTRMGKPSPEVCAKIAAKIDPLFPQPEPMVNRELLSLLVYLDSPSAPAKAVPLIESTIDEGDLTAENEKLLSRNDGYADAARSAKSSRPNRQAIAYAYSLRNAKVGWNPQLLKTFFGWFPRTKGWKGGNSFTKFIDNIRNDALNTSVKDNAQRAELDTASKQAPPAPAANLVAPKGPGKPYSVDDVVGIATNPTNRLVGRNYEQGKAMFASVLCINCHHFNGDGGNVGPDLTGAGSRYSLRDLAENIVEPSKVISEQYGSEQIEKKDGSFVVGRVVVEENGKLFVMTSAFAPNEQTAINSDEVKSRKPFNTSMMPPGLINSLNHDELRDLLAYIISAGNPQDKMFQK